MFVDNHTIMFFRLGEFRWGGDISTLTATTSELYIDTPAQKLFIKSSSGDRRTFYLKSVVWMDADETIRGWNYESQDGSLKVLITKMLVNT